MDSYYQLQQWHTAIAIDDSDSMSGDYWNQVKDFIVRICTEEEPDGIDLYFFKHNSHAVENITTGKGMGGYYNIKTTTDVENIFNHIIPSGGAPTHQCLERILGSYTTAYRNDREKLPGLSLDVIIGKAPDSCDKVKQTICRYAKMLDDLSAPPTQVGILFSQVGKDPKATEFLRQLDSGLGVDVRDMVDVTKWEDMEDENGLQSVLGATKNEDY